MHGQGQGKDLFGTVILVYGQGQGKDLFGTVILVHGQGQSKVLREVLKLRHVILFCVIGTNMTSTY